MRLAAHPESGRANSRGLDEASPYYSWFDAVTHAYLIERSAQDAPETAAHGHLVHVYVDRATNRPVPLPAGLRRALEHLQ